MELECWDYIQALHTEAERALYEHVRTANRGRADRYMRLTALLRALRSVDSEAVAGLFFRPVAGTSSVDEHVLALFYELAHQKLPHTTIYSMSASTAQSAEKCDDNQQRHQLVSNTVGKHCVTFENDESSIQCKGEEESSPYR